MSFNTPILFLIFNRPDKTKVVFDEIKKLRPKFLYIGADGPRDNKPGESKLCGIARQIATDIDWDCDLKTLFRDENIGCGQAPAKAITWFFENVDQGIIIEDDCLPNHSFFNYCEVLLEKYKNDPLIMHISGNNFQKGVKRGDADYYFSIYSHTWGWASWKRAWQHYDIEMKNFDKSYLLSKLKNLSRDSNFGKHWMEIFENCYYKQPNDIWDYQWTYTIWMHDGICILPQVNLISNIGFGKDATHTTLIESWISQMESKHLIVSKFPKKNKVDIIADSNTSKEVFGITQNRLYYISRFLSYRTLKLITKKLILLIIPEHSKAQYRRYKNKKLNKNYRNEKELNRLKFLPRFIKGNTNLLNNNLTFTDSASLLFIYDEIFNKEIYKFNSNNSEPYIIDAGANIGLGIIYFKQLFPTCEIIAFEPDEQVFDALSLNMKSFNLDKITLIKQALWNEDTVLQFYSEGADGGRIALKEDKKQLVKIRATSLRSYLKRKVDFLKLDIEGAETTVLEDCSDLLLNVENLFVEYHSIINYDQSLHKLLQTLNTAGFRYQIQHIGTFSPNPFIQINDYNKMDLQLNIFAYRS